MLKCEKSMAVWLYNTLGRKKQKFRPLQDKKVFIYTCGPTVYWYAHLGNLRTYIFEDLLKRTLLYNGYRVKHVMNITDVGHLTSDADTGEDKLEKGARREKKTVWEIARFYTNAFKTDLKRLNILAPDVWVKATQTIKDQIELIKILEKKGFTYVIEDGVYFDSSKLKTYGRLWPNKKKMKLIAGARVEMVKGKRHATDFALWKFTPPGVKRQMEWPSPWGRGFPGWHTECVVMASKYLGVPFDIHCGGVDHILIHHTNEIAQAEAAFGKILARYWLHGEFLIFEKGKMSKSEGKITILQDLINKGFNPLSYRYLCLTAHYRSKLTFSWQAIESSNNALNSLYEVVRDTLSQKSKKTNLSLAELKKEKKYIKDFKNYINDDLNIPKALALAWKVAKDNTLNPELKRKILLDFDKVFGLSLDKVKKERVPKKVLLLLKKREELRLKKQWKEADAIREELKKLGWKVEDTKEGPVLKRNSATV